ncbi:MAG TPA: OmpW family outer membrane protein [Thermoanaerobaculia bacterium]|nr:OmpW family outer membrane protein [Thermoanaerobaculia bacterium]
MRIHAVVALAVAFTAFPLAAQSNDVGVWYSTAQLKDTAGLSFDRAKGSGVSFNHFWTESISTEFAVHSIRAKAAIDVEGTHVLQAGKLKLMPVTANVQWHPMRESMFSPYVGAGLARVSSNDLSSSDLDLAGIGNVKIGNKMTWDANAGVNILIGRAFALAVDGKYIALEPDAKANGSSEKLKLNPLVISAGVKLRF